MRKRSDLAGANLSDTEVELIQAGAPVCHFHSRQRLRTANPLLKSRTDYIPASLQGANNSDLTTF